MQVILTIILFTNLHEIFFLLKGFENRPLETKTSNQLEMLALEKTLMANIVGVLSHDTMLVTLVDDTVSPPMDIARRMNQLSQPRSSHEVCLIVLLKFTVKSNIDRYKWLSNDPFKQTMCGKFPNINRDG